MKKIFKFYREDELESKWWHRLIKVLIYGSTIVVFVFYIGFFIENINSWKNPDPRYIYSFEPNYSDTLGFSKPCTFASGNSKESIFIDCGNIGKGWPGNKSGFLPDFLERYAKSNLYKEEFLTKVPLHDCADDLSDIFCDFKVLSVDYEFLNKKIDQGEFNHIKVKKIIIFTKLLQNTAITLLIPTLWFFLLKSVVYRAIIYIILGKKNNL